MNQLIDQTIIKMQDAIGAVEDEIIQEALQILDRRLFTRDAVLVVIW